MATKIPKNISGNTIDFPYAIKSFVGFLEGTKKSAHTIKNYRLDICSFEDFLLESYPGKTRKLDEIDRNDVMRYRHYLKEKGLKTNTRRRKILTVTQFLNYLAKRKKLAPEMAQKLPAPHKVERVPFTVSAKDLVTAIQNLEEKTLLDSRNKALLWTLAETGCLVSELTELRYEQWGRSPSGSSFVHLGGKSNRAVPVSNELYQAIFNLRGKSTKESPWIFSGFNKFGSLGGPITPRGVEMIVKHYGRILKVPDLTPRTFRHSVILMWFESGLPQSEIQSRLGLKTTYAFRSYEPLLKTSQAALSIPSISTKQTTSTAETPPQES